MRPGPSAPRTTAPTSTTTSTSLPSSAKAAAALHFDLPLGGTTARVTVTTRRAGDMRAEVPGEARANVLPGPQWCTVRQVHGAAVVGALEAGAPADAIVASPGDRPAMLAADCALLGLASPEGIVATVHAGWKGLRDGVVEETVRAARELGASKLVGLRGPCIGPECYEFGEEDLACLTELYGSGLRSRTSWGSPALDLAEGVRRACERADVELLYEVDECTACSLDPDGSPRWFSHRARNDKGRHALVVSEQL